MNGLLAWLKSSWFLVGIIVALVVSAVAPQVGSHGGPLALGPWNDALFVLMFLASGVALRTAELGSALGHWRLHLATQGFNLGLTPLLGLAVDPFLGWCGVGESLRLGVLVMLCMPMTISSCVLITRMAGGNEAAALTQATLGGILGIVLTPLWLLLLIGGRADIDPGKAILHLSLIVVLPVLVGQALQRLTPGIVRAKGVLNNLSTIALLLNLYQAFCLSFSQPEVRIGWSLLGLAAAMGATHLALLGAAWAMARWRWWRLDRGERIAVAFCASHKTVALGIPLLGVLFHGRPDIGLIALPLVAFHLTENLLDGAIATRLRRSREPHLMA